VERAVDAFQDAWAGEWKDEEDFAAALLEQTGDLDTIPEHLRFYFDYAAFARDLFINDYSSVDAPGGVYVFRRN
jgi:antirestriction protein